MSRKAVALLLAQWGGHRGLQGPLLIKLSGETGCENSNKLGSEFCGIMQGLVFNRHTLDELTLPVSSSSPVCRDSLVMMLRCQPQGDIMRQIEGRDLLVPKVLIGTSLGDGGTQVTDIKKT